MPEEGFKHKLAAILSADVVGYSRLMADDELATIRTLSAYRDKICTHVHDNGGRVVDFVGDNMLADFSSALNAVNCAVKIQNALDQLNVKFDEKRRMLFRIGIDLGEIVIDKDVIYGDGVNIAARLEPLSKPGGICLSEDVARQIQNKIEFPLKKLPNEKLKNIQSRLMVTPFFFKFTSTAVFP